MSVSYKPGDIIMDNSFPVMKFLMNGFRTTVCNNCFQKASELIPCPHCGIYYYCNPDCLKEDWDKAHSVECQSHCFRTYCSRGFFKDIKRLVFRMYAMLKLDSDIETKPFTLPDGSTRTFKDMSANTDAVDRNRPLARKLLKMSTVMASDIPSNKCGLKYLVRMCGIHQANSFSITDGTNVAPIGWGIYVEPSIYDHSCKNNALFMTAGLKLQVRVIGPIPAGSKPCISYIGDVLSRLERRKMLWQRYCFYCNCNMCVSYADKDVNYPRLKDMMANMHQQWKEPEHTKAWEDIKKQHDEIIGLLKIMFHEYDMHATSEHIRLLKVALKMNVEGDELKSLYETALEYVKISYGHDHFVYTELDSDYKLAFPL